ncbi:AMP-binding protein [Nocardia sp. NBC_00508]|uniref:AMP-binding protein n=1 Tax=Nocardia sp. NBC_00508 TaxID=2975992 RepID=UPI002E812C92|nr:AMP-binding protein [Nocardia sp. NBC_00508]WUD68710.1 AMP-binding protein [Nocardia sp. NBC_00508]
MFTAAECERLVGEWANGVELTDIVGIAEVLRRGRLVPPLRTVVCCDSLVFTYGDLAEYLGRPACVDNPMLADLLRLVSDVDAATRTGAALPLTTADGRTVLLTPGAVAAAVADRRSVAAHTRGNGDRATGSADVRLIVPPWGGADLLIELLAAIADGAALILATEEPRHDPSALVDLIAERSVTHVVADAHTLARLGHIGATALPTVRRWDVTQTHSPASLPELLLALASGSVGSVTYRATAYAGPVARGRLDGTGRVRPVPGARVLVLDESRHPVPPGVIGEVYIGGAALVTGFADITDHFVADPHRANGRLFRTGDHAHWTSDGWLAAVTP